MSQRLSNRVSNYSSILCGKCYWCAIYLDKTRKSIDNKCLYCSAGIELSSFSIMSNESFTTDYNERRGVELDSDPDNVTLIHEEMSWFLKRAREERRDRLKLAIVAANNHHAGFGLRTANTFRKMLDLPEATWVWMEVSEARENAFG